MSDNPLPPKSTGCGWLYAWKTSLSPLQARSHPRREKDKKGKSKKDKKDKKDKKEKKDKKSKHKKKHKKGKVAISPALLRALSGFRHLPAFNASYPTNSFTFYALI